MSLCDSCRDPGACCRSFSLFPNELQEGQVPVRDDLTDMSALDAEEAGRVIIAQDLPFIVLEENENGHAVLGCAMLSPKGRCTIYEDRPQLCRDFTAGGDELCIETMKEKENAASI